MWKFHSSLYCHIGVVITKEEIKDAVATLLSEKKAELEEKRYRVNIGVYLQTLRNKLKWADGKLLSDELNEQLAAVLGPRTAEDDKKPDNKAKGKEPEKKEEKKEDKPGTVARTVLFIMLTIIL